MKCWDNFERGEKLNRYLDDGKEILQTADCFVDGLQAICFHNPSDFSWIPALEQNYQDVLSELLAYELKRRGQDMPPSSDRTALQQLIPTGTGEEGDGLWMGPRDTSGTIAFFKH